MKLRTHHFVCMLLLLSALRAADGSIVHAGGYGFASHNIVLLLGHDGANVWSQVKLTDRHHDWRGTGGFIPASQLLPERDAYPALTATSAAAIRTTWTMRPPSAHSTSVHAVTGLAPRFAL